MKRPRETTIAAVMSLLALAGCAASPSAVDPAISSLPSATPSPTPTVDPADPANWVVDFNGIGPLQLGEPFSADLPEFGEFTPGTDQFCDPRVRDFKAASGTALTYNVFLTTRLADDQATVGDFISVGLTQTSGSEPILRTAEGIGMGSTELETKAAYPAGVEKSVFPDGTYPYLSVPNGSGHFLLFHFGGGGEGDGNGGPVSSISVQSFEYDLYEFC